MRGNLRKRLFGLACLGLTISGWSVAGLTLAGLALQPASAQPRPGSSSPSMDAWNPRREYDHVQTQCAIARAVVDMDLCQQSSKQLVADLRKCIRNNSPRNNSPDARVCAQLLPGAQGTLRTVNKSLSRVDPETRRREAGREFQNNSVTPGNPAPLPRP